MCRKCIRQKRLLNYHGVCELKKVEEKNILLLHNDMGFKQELKVSLDIRAQQLLFS